MQHLRLLAGRRAARWEHRRFVVEGPKLLAEALAGGASVEAVFLDDNAADDDHRRLAARAAGTGARTFQTAAGVLSRACDAVTPQPVVAIVAMVDRPITDLSPRPPGPVVVAVDLQDPGNAGTVLRSAAASGSGAVVFCSGAVDVYNPKAVRASAGALFHLPIVVGVPAAEALDRLGRCGLRRVATVARGGQAYDRTDLSSPMALVLGSESHGLPSGLDDHLDERVTIPMVSSSESLNVAMAATVICFEAARQRRIAPPPADQP